MNNTVQSETPATLPILMDPSSGEHQAFGLSYVKILEKTPGDPLAGVSFCDPWSLRSSLVVR